MTNAKLKDGWVVCGNCGKKLERVVGKEVVIRGIERKCPGCKEINQVNITQVAKGELK